MCRPNFHSYVNDLKVAESSTPLLLSFIDYEQAFDLADRRALVKGYPRMVCQTNMLTAVTSSGLLKLKNKEPTFSQTLTGYPPDHQLGPYNSMQLNARYCT